jgi:hypothetical protein
LGRKKKERQDFEVPHGLSKKFCTLQETAKNKDHWYAVDNDRNGKSAKDARNVKYWYTIDWSPTSRIT